MDSTLIGYGIDDSNGAAYTSIGTMIEANESTSYLPILKRDSDRKSKQKMENTKGKKKRGIGRLLLCCANRAA